MLIQVQVVLVLLGLLGWLNANPDLFANCRHKLNNGKIVDFRKAASEGIFKVYDQYQNEFQVTMCTPNNNICKSASGFLSFVVPSETHGQQAQCLPLSQKASDATFAASISVEDWDTHVVLKYDSGVSSGSLGTMIRAHCDKSMKTSTMTYVAEENHHGRTYFVFKYTGKPACGTGSGGCGALGCVVGWGGLLLILGFVAIVLYVIVGVIIQIVRKQRGLDIIPNRKIWVYVIFLEKDGFLFAFELIKSLVLKIKSAIDKRRGSA